MENSSNPEINLNKDSAPAAVRPQKPAINQNQANQEKQNKSEFRKGCLTGGISGCMLTVICGLFILGLLTAIALNSDSLSGSVKSASAANFEKCIIDETESKDLNDQIFVLPISGTITSGSWYGDKVKKDGNVTAEYVSYALEFIKSQDNVKALIIDVDSPGGGVTASDCIYHEIKKFKEETKIPVIAMFESTACSGGYYAAMAADEIMALPTCWTGSIGVIMQVPEAEQLMQKVGVNVNTIKSLNSEGKESFKDIGSTFRKMRPEERALLQTLVTESWSRFTGIVAEGRKGKLTLKEVQKLADGRIYSSQQALKNKLIDKIGYRQDLYALARERAKSPNASIVCVNQKENIFDSFAYVCSNLNQAAANFNSAVSAGNIGADSVKSTREAVQYALPYQIEKP